MLKNNISGVKNNFIENNINVFIRSEKKDLKIKLKKEKLKEKRRMQYPNRSDYRLLLKIKPIAILHDMYHNIFKTFTYIYKIDSIIQFISKKIKK